VKEINTTPFTMIHFEQQRNPTSGDTTSRRKALAGTVSHANALNAEAKEPPRVRQASAPLESKTSISRSHEFSHSATFPERSKFVLYVGEGEVQSSREPTACVIANYPY
jgi:hypothetical protein